MDDSKADIISEHASLSVNVVPVKCMVEVGYKDFNSNVNYFYGRDISTVKFSPVAVSLPTKDY